MIKIERGNLLHVAKGIIAHQVNCQGVMNSGVAKQVREKYPVAFKEYRELVSDFVDNNMDVKDLLGRVNGVKVDNDLYVANMFGQLHYGYDGQQYTDTEALLKCFLTVKKVAKGVGLPIYMPYMIGCYRGGADWKEVEGLLINVFDDYDATLLKL